MTFDKYYQALHSTRTMVQMGRVDKIIGMIIESTGPQAGIGELCLIQSAGKDRWIKTEVVGFRGDKVLLMPFEDQNDIGPGSVVRAMGGALRIPVGEELVGRVLDGFGNPIDGREALTDVIYCPVNNLPSNPLERPRIGKRIHFGVKAIDSLMTCGKGQRLGIFSGSGVGKSTLLGMIARNVEADVNVIALVGERGREVRDFIEKDLKEEGMKRSVLVVATSDQPAMMRLKCALTATTIAEYFSNSGKDVLLMMDSLTRFAMAQREIGLAMGEPPVARGYTPSIYSALPKLLERSGNFKNSSITAVYTVLVEGDDVNEPISDTVRGIIDGHIVLSRAIAMKNHYPAIDVLASISRLMSDVVDRDFLETAGKIRSILSIYKENEDLISIGAYRGGTNPELDEAIARIDRINAFLTQDVNEKVDAEEVAVLMKELIS